MCLAAKATTAELHRLGYEARLESGGTSVFIGSSRNLVTIDST
jgi:hypothetical protein